MIRSALRLVTLNAVLAFTASFAARAAEPAAPASEDPTRVIAIDVLLEPSPAMAKFAEAANKGVRRDYPAGFTLGAEQAPHITLVHRYVRFGDLPKLEAQLAEVLSDHNPLIIQLTAVGYEHGPAGNLALMIIDIERSDALDRVQTKVAETVEPFSVPSGSADAFAVSRELPKVDQNTVDYVKDFIPSASGANYRPHITVGLAHNSVVKDIEAIRFPRRTFRPSAVAIYQLGAFGTAQKKLWSWKPGSAKP